MKKWLLVCSLLILTAFLVYARHVKLTKQNNIKRHMTYTLGQEPLGCKKTFPSLTPGISYTIKASIWDSIGTNVYAVIVMNEDESAQLVSSSVKRGTHQVTFKMPEGTKDVHFYINATNSTTAPGPAHNFYIDDVQMTYPGMVTVQEPTDDYRFGFNDMEKDNEVKGTGNSYDFGARIYDPRLGRWLSTDPLQKQYAWASPYSFCGNNPIMFQDIDGKDYGLIIDHKTKTIIVVANYYTTEANKAEAEAAVNLWNNNSGKFEYVILDDQGKPIQYKVEFKLTVDATSKDMGEAKRKANNDPQGNSYEEVDKKTFVEKGGKNEEDKGITKGEQYVIINNETKEPESGAHELGHTLGLEHFGEGLMRRGVYRVKQEDFLTKANIGAILDNLGFAGPRQKALIKINSDMKDPNSPRQYSVIDEMGIRPNNFDQGEVQKVQQ